MRVWAPRPCFFRVAEELQPSFAFQLRRVANHSFPHPRRWKLESKLEYRGRRSVVNSLWRKFTKIRRSISGHTRRTPSSTSRFQHKQAHKAVPDSRFPRSPALMNMLRKTKMSFQDDMSRHKDLCISANATSTRERFSGGLSTKARFWRSIAWI